MRDRFEKLIEKVGREYEENRPEINVHTAPSGTQYVYPSEVLNDPKVKKEMEKLSLIVETNKRRRS